MISHGFFHGFSIVFSMETFPWTLSKVPVPADGRPCADGAKVPPVFGAVGALQQVGQDILQLLQVQHKKIWISTAFKE
jgi:hypothetical protein